MAGLHKSTLRAKLETALRSSQILESHLSEGRQKSTRLPWYLKIDFGRGIVRAFNIYMWTVSHGGKGRPAQEYRIQVTLSGNPLRFDRDVTTLLLGYYDERFDKQAPAVANRRDDSSMEVVVAWNPLRRLEPGSSSSCQVLYGTLREAHLYGKAYQQRELASGNRENVLVFKPRLFDEYLKAAAGGHGAAYQEFFREENT